MLATLERIRWVGEFAMGGWIKMRGGLFQSPKLIALFRILMESREFRDWVTPGGGGGLNGQIVSDDALRCVALALLLRVWSAAREFGRFDGDDLILPGLTIGDLDVLASAPAMGEAMESVGWAIGHDEPLQVILPNFKEHNVPATNSERMKDYRRRKSVTPRCANVTKDAQRNEGEPLRDARNETLQNVTSREEKRREEEIQGDSPQPPVTLNLQHERNENVTQRNDEDDLGWLVREFLHRYSGPSKLNLHEDCRKLFGELLRQGVAKAIISAEIARNDRNRSEWPSILQSRLLRETKGQGTKPAPTTAKPTFAEQMAARMAAKEGNGGKP